MSDSQEAKFEPISASADGKRNRYSRRCDVLGQVMNYAACLWRQGVLSKPDIRTPADWAPCGEAARCGRCNAVQMRQEEELKGHAIYFIDREAKQTLSAEARARIMPSYDKSSREAPRRPAVSAPTVPAARPTSVSASAVLDMAGDTYAEAINAMVAAPATPPAAAPRGAAPLPKIDMLPGESPLAYARRLRAAQQPSA